MREAEEKKHAIKNRGNTDIQIRFKCKGRERERKFSSAIQFSHREYMHRHFAY